MVIGAKKHILFISSWYPNRNNPTHGIFNVNFAIAAAVHHQVSVLHVCSDDKIDSEYELVTKNENHIHTVTVYYKKVKKSLPGFSALTKVIKQLKAYNLGFNALLNNSNKPDLIQLNVMLPAGIGALHLSKKHSIPFVVNEGWTGYMPEDGSYNYWLFKLLTKRIASKAKAIMPVSERLKQAMLFHNLRGNYTIVPNVVDVNSFSISTEQIRLPASFVHISALDDKQKNVSGIIRSFANAHKTNNQLRLTIVGDGEDRVKLENLVKQLKLNEAITFTGRLFNSDLVKHIQISQALVMFSNYETFCLTIAEALACGIPVITSRAGGLTDQINPELGISVRPMDEEALSNAMLLFTQQQHRYNVHTLRNFVASNFSIEIIAQKLKDVYSHALFNSEQS